MIAEGIYRALGILEGIAMGPTEPVEAKMIRAVAIIEREAEAMGKKICHLEKEREDLMVRLEKEREDLMLGAAQRTGREKEEQNPKDETQELVFRLRRHYLDAVEGKSRSLSQIVNDCVRAADLIGALIEEREEYGFRKYAEEQ